MAAFRHLIFLFKLFLMPLMLLEMAVGIFHPAFGVLCKLAPIPDDKPLLLAACCLISKHGLHAFREAHVVGLKIGVADDEAPERQKDRIDRSRELAHHACNRMGDACDGESAIEAKKERFWPKLYDRELACRRMLPALDKVCDLARRLGAEDAPRCP